MKKLSIIFFLLSFMLIACNKEPIKEPDYRLKWAGNYLRMYYVTPSDNVSFSIVEDSDSLMNITIKFYEKVYNCNYDVVIHADGTFYYYYSPDNFYNPRLEGYFYDKDSLFLRVKVWSNPSPGGSGGWTTARFKCIKLYAK